MGEAKRSQTRQVIIAGEPRCIYCPGPAATLEHMPPKGMFRDRQRPDAMVYCACKACNNGTRGSDAVAALIARMHPDNGEESWQTKEFRKLISAIDTYAPGVRQVQPCIDATAGLRPSSAGRPSSCGWTARQGTSRYFRSEASHGAVPRACWRCVAFGRRRLVPVRTKCRDDSRESKSRPSSGRSERLQGCRREQRPRRTERAYVTWDSPSV
jgi:hypothetical protein